MNSLVRVYLLGFALLALLFSCSAKIEKRGGLMLILQKDADLTLDEVRVRVLRGEDNFEIGSNRFHIEPDTLPGSLAIVNTRPNASLKLRVSGWYKEQPLDVRDLFITNVPTRETKAITVTLSAKCEDFAKRAGDDVASTCEEGQTCLPHLGACSANTQDAGELPPYDPTPLSPSPGNGGAENQGTGGSGAGRDNSGHPVGGSDGSANGGTGGRPRGCEPGEKRCNKLTPEVCSEAGEWGPARDACAYGCAQGECVECAEDTSECKDGAVIVCKDGKWSTEQVCENICEDATCTDQCTEDHTQCNGDRVQRCTGGQFIDEESCQFLCQRDACAGECKPNATECTPDRKNEYRSCDAQGVWGESRACPTGTFCVSGECRACEPGSRRCGAGGPETCSETGFWVPGAPCAGGAPVCFEGSCVQCAPGEKRCNGSELQQCTTEGTGWSKLESCDGETPVCLDASLKCGRCKEGQVQCDGDAVVKCTDQGTFEVIAVCTGGNPQCVAGACKPCDPNASERRCLDLHTVQACKADGTWGETTSCTGDKPLCREGAFVCACQEGERRCKNSTTPEVCQGGAWVQATPCSGTLDYCLPSSGTCVDCEPGKFQCVGSVAYECSEAGSWLSLQTCAAGTVNCGSCDLGEPCEKSSDCTSPNVCVNKKCAECNPGDEQCRGRVVYACTSSGTWSSLNACKGAKATCAPCNCQDESTQSCADGGAKGQCANGIQKCVMGNWGPCSVSPSTRVCNSSLDNDCDGKPDNTLDSVCQCSVGAVEECGQHPGLDNQGICRAGTRTCLSGAGNTTSSWGTCVGSVGPSEELCKDDGVDENCNGQTNETPPCNCTNGAVQPCGNCNGGTQTCTNGAWGPCTGQPGAPVTYYRDEDGDGFGDPTVTITSCTGSAPAGYVSDNTDCCDHDARAKPGQTGFWTDERIQCGGWDFNCDGVQTVQYPNSWPACLCSSFVCTRTCYTPGMFVNDNGTQASSIPGCGQSARWRTCTEVGTTCTQNSPADDRRTQPCH